MTIYSDFTSHSQRTSEPRCVCGLKISCTNCLHDDGHCRTIRFHGKSDSAQSFRSNTSESIFRVNGLGTGGNPSGKGGDFADNQTNYP